MPDSPETKVLKDINRHLKNIDESGAMETAAETPELETIKAMKGVIGNFESIMDAKLKRVVLTSERAFNEAFGNLQGFDAKQNDSMIAELDNVIDELQTQNRLTMKSDDLAFLREKERDEEVKINEETNEILEDIRDQGDMKRGGPGEAGLSGLPLEIVGGLLTALGLKGLSKKLFTKAGLIGLGKSLGKKAFAAFSLTSFAEGFAEDADDKTKTFGARLVSGLGNLLEDLSFGLISDEEIERLGGILRSKLSKAGADLQKSWDDYWQGGKPLGDAMAEALSALTLGMVTPEGMKKIGANFAFLADELGKLVVVNALEALGFEVKKEFQDQEEQKRKREAGRAEKEFKMAARIDVPLERLMKEAGLSFERKTQIREQLGGRFAPLTAEEMDKKANEWFGSPEKAEEYQEEIAADRKNFIELQTKLLENRIRRNKEQEERDRQKIRDDIKAKADAFRAEQVRQEQIKAAVESFSEEEANKARLAGGDTFVDASTQRKMYGLDEKRCRPAR